MRRALLVAALGATGVLASANGAEKIELDSKVAKEPGENHQAGPAFRLGKKHHGKHHGKRHHGNKHHEEPKDVQEEESKEPAHGISSHACVWTSPSGHTFDLTAFSSHEQEFNLNGMAADGKADSFKYRFSVCKSLRSVAPNCVKHHLEGSPSLDAVAAVQEDSFGNCFALGSTHHVAFSLHDEKNPQLGLDVTYSHGTPCSDGRPRELKLHFTCSQHHTVEIPPRFVVEQAEHCHYHVNWPSTHGCPLSGLSSLLLHAKLGVLGTSGAHAFHLNNQPAATTTDAAATTADQPVAGEHHDAGPVSAPASSESNKAPSVAAAAAATSGATSGATLLTASAMLAKIKTFTVWDWMWLSSVVWYGGLFLYCFFGTAANVWRGKGEFGLETIPHKAYWDGWLNLMVPQSLRKRVVTTPIVSQLVAAAGAVVSLALKIVHFSVIGVRAVVKPTARFIGNRMPLTWTRTRGCLGAPSGDYPSTDDGKGPYAEKQKPVVRLRWEGGATDGHLVRRLAKGASAEADEGDLTEQWYDEKGPVQTFAGDVKTAASEAAAREAARKKGGFTQADFDAVRIGGLKMDAENGLGKRRGPGGGDPAPASASSHDPPQHYGQDPDGHGPVFGQSVATADLLLIGGDGSTGISAAAGTTKGLPAVQAGNKGGNKRR